MINPILENALLVKPFNHQTSDKHKLTSNKNKTTKYQPTIPRLQGLKVGKPSQLSKLKMIQCLLELDETLHTKANVTIITIAVFGYFRFLVPIPPCFILCR